MALDTLRRDVTYALRGFRREPGLVAIATIILALGIGANTAVFSIVNPIVLRPLPFPESEQLVWMANTSGTGLSGATYRTDVFSAFREHSRSFQEISGYFAFFGFMNRTLTGGGDPESVSAVDTAPRFFDVLGVRPAIGRLFVDAEHHGGGPLRAAILTHGFWQRRFAGAPGLVGSAITINGQPVTVVGVLPADFDFSSVFTPGTRVDMFLALDLDLFRPMGNTLSLVGRLRPGVTLTEARAEFATLWPQLLQENRSWSPRWGVRLTDLHETVSGSMRRPLLLLWGAVGFVLLIVCANLANLLLARASRRSREFAVRTALGARRGQLVRQLLAEGLLLSCTGAVLGVPLAVGLIAWVTRSGAFGLPLIHYVRVDTPALVVTIAIAVITGLLFAMIPAYRGTRAPQHALQEQGRGTVDSPRQALVRRGLVVSEIALAAVLLVGAGLLGRSFVRLIGTDPGFRPEQVIAARLQFTGRPNRPQVVSGTRELSRRVSRLSGVEAAGVSDALPLDRNRSWNIGVPGQLYPDNQIPATFVYMVGPGYFRAMGIEQKTGRDFDERDAPEVGSAQRPRAVVLNETLARTLYPNGDALGRPAFTGKTPLTIVGIVADVRQSSLDEAPVPQMYLSWAEGDGVSADLIVRSSLPAATLVPMLRKTMTEVDPSLVATDVRAIQAIVETSISPRRFIVSLLTGFSLLALLLACLGIYGVVSYGVQQRTAEIGLRMALGATGSDVRRHIVGDTLRMTLVGVTIGAAASLALTRLIGALLFATSSTDPMIFLMMVVLLGSVALIAGLLPAMRASRINPICALK